MDNHLGYPKNGLFGEAKGNSRNGYTSKTLKGDHGEIEINTPEIDTQILNPS